MEQNILRQLSELMKQQIDKGYVSGAAIKVIHEDQTIYQDELGHANLENGTPIKKDTIYRMFSMSKPVTAVATMILYERGIINLLDPVADYLPGFRDQKVLTEAGLVSVKRQATLQDLLNMTSGLVYPDGSFEAGRKMGELFQEVEQGFHQGKFVNTIEFANRIGQQPLEFEPGERWRYGTSADVLGAVIEVASGKRFGQFLQEEIFAPLDMPDTAFYVPKDKWHRFSEFYDYKWDTNHLEPFHNDFLAIFDYKQPPAFESGGAGLVSTMEDYSHFALMLVNGGTYKGTRILGRKTVEYLAMPQLTKEQMVSFDWDSMYGYSYGNLMRSMVDLTKATSNGSVGEFGWDGWSGVYFLVDPKEKLVFLYLIQRCGGTGPNLTRKLRNIVYGAL